jgi:hypothetical protein
LWASLATAVSQIQPGTINEFQGFDNLPWETTDKLPSALVKAWEGDVIRLDGGNEPLYGDTLSELNINLEGMPSHAAERLVWSSIRSSAAARR